MADTRPVSMDMGRSPTRSLVAGLSARGGVQDYKGVAERMKQQIAVKDRKQLMKVYNKVFLGCDAVDWLTSSGVAESEWHAVGIGNAMLAAGLFHNVPMEHAFENRPYMYRFAEDEFERMQDKLKYIADTPYEALSALAARMRTEVPVADREFKGRMVPRCFLGITAVSWLLQGGAAKTEVEAMGVGNAMIKWGLVHHVGMKKGFEHAKDPFRFPQDAAALLAVRRRRRRRAGEDGVMRSLSPSGEIPRSLSPVRAGASSDAEGAELGPADRESEDEDEDMLQNILADVMPGSGEDGADSDNDDAYPPVPPGDRSGRQASHGPSRTSGAFDAAGWTPRDGALPISGIMRRGSAGSVAQEVRKVSMPSAHTRLPPEDITEEFLKRLEEIAELFPAPPSHSVAAGEPAARPRGFPRPGRVSSQHFELQLEAVSF